MADRPVLALSDDALRHDADRIRSRMAEIKDRWENGLSLNKLDIAKEYVRGHLCIVLKGDPGTAGSAREGKSLALRNGKGRAVEIGKTATYFSTIGHDHQFISRRGMHDGRQHTVLVRPIETVRNVEEVTRAAGEHLKRLEPLFEGGWHFYGATSSFETLRISSLGEVELLVLAAARAADDLPGEVIEGRPEIVDSIAYGQGDFWRRSQDGQSDVHLPVIRLSDRRIEILPREGDQLPFEISDVMIGPFEF